MWSRYPSPGCRLAYPFICPCRLVLARVHAPRYELATHATDAAARVPGGSGGRSASVGSGSGSGGDAAKAALRRAQVVYEAGLSAAAQAPLAAASAARSTCGADRVEVALAAAGAAAAAPAILAHCDAAAAGAAAARGAAAAVAEYAGCYRQLLPADSGGTATLGRGAADPSGAFAVDAIRDLVADIAGGAAGGAAALCVLRKESVRALGTGSALRRKVSD